MLRRAYGDAAMGRNKCFEWHSWFKGGQTSVKDGDRSNRPRTRPTPKKVPKIAELI